MRKEDIVKGLINTGDTFLTIPAGQTTAASAFDCVNAPPLALVTPLGWLASNLTFQVLPFLLPGVNYTNNLPANNQLAPVGSLAGDGTLYTIITGADYGFYGLPPALFGMIRYINIISSVTQTSAQAVSLVLTPLWQGIHS